jgi:hypothetical protein
MERSGPTGMLVRGPACFAFVDRDSQPIMLA